jgi:CubicO group peptidase (beta-lactamase class C family)
MGVAVKGYTTPQFDSVRSVFASNFEHEGEVGAAVSVYRHGEKVIDLWGGYADVAQKAEWKMDTICGFYSTGKPLVALSLLQLIDSQEIALDDEVANIWRDYKGGGKEKTTFRQVLCHQAGMSAVRKRLPEGAMLDWQLMVDVLAAQHPWWKPGSRHVYHTNTFGFLVGEPVRLLTGLNPGQFLQNRIAAPLEEHLYFGVPEEMLSKVATLYMDNADLPPDISFLDNPMSDEARMLAHGIYNPSGFSSLGVLNSRAWRQAQVPSTNGHGTARGIAHVYGILASGGASKELTILSPGMLEEASCLQSRGYCPALEREVDFGLGFQLTRTDRPFGPNPGSYGHFGTGGSLGFADPETGIGFGYVMNRVKPRWQNPRNRALLDAVYGCL